MFKRYLVLSVSALISTACTSRGQDVLPENYHADLATWKQDRDERLRSDNGWVNLAGLYWLEEGVNSFGSSADNNVIFPENAPAHIGTIVLADSVLTFISAPDLDVVVDSASADSITVYDPGKEIIRTMKHGRYLWFIIERAGNYGIRLRDLEDPRTLQPLNIQYFDWSPEWRVTAEYRPFDSPRTIAVDNVVGFSSDEEFTGEFVFEIDGRQYSLWPSIDETGSFIMFADATSGEESYGSGRYLAAGLPDSNNTVILDFNMAFNPPCAFSDFATCPLPPRQNVLDIPVRAGEMEYHLQDDRKHSR